MDVGFAIFNMKFQRKHRRVHTYVHKQTSKGARDINNRLTEIAKKKKKGHKLVEIVLWVQIKSWFYVRKLTMLAQSKIKWC